jgi:hypothetical protein
MKGLKNRYKRARSTVASLVLGAVLLGAIAAAPTATASTSQPVQIHNVGILYPVRSLTFSAAGGVFGNGVSGPFEVVSFFGTPTPPTFLHSNSGTGHRVDVYTTPNGTFTIRLQELGHTTQVGSEFATIGFTGHGTVTGGTGAYAG